MYLALMLKNRKEWNESRTLILWYEIWDVTILVVMCCWLLDIVCWGTFQSGNQCCIFQDLSDWSSPLLWCLSWTVVNPVLFFHIGALPYEIFWIFWSHCHHLPPRLYLPTVLYIVSDGPHQLRSHNILYCPPVISQDNYGHLILLTILTESLEM